MGNLKAMMRTALYRRTFKQFTRTIMHQVKAADELWEIDEALDLLLNLGDKGDLNAMIIYAMILLRDDNSAMTLSMECQCSKRCLRRALLRLSICSAR